MLGLSLGLFRVSGGGGLPLDYEVQRITYTADGGSWKISASGTELAHDVSENDLTAEILSLTGLVASVSTVIDGNDYEHTITFAEATNVAEFVPVDVSLYTSEAGSPTVTVVTQGADAISEVKEQFTVSVGIQTGSVSFGNGDLSGSVDSEDGAITNISAPSGFSAISGGVGLSSVIFEADTAGVVADFTETSNTTSGGGVSTNQQGVNAVSAVAEVTEISRGSANFGTLTVSGGVLDYNDSNNDVASAVGVAASRTFTAGTGDGSTGNPWVLTDSSAGAVSDLTLSSHTLEIRTSTAGTLTATTITEGTNHLTTDITLDNSDVDERAGNDAVVGNLTTTDEDPADAWTYTLVSGTGSTDNALFNISGNQLRATSSLTHADAETRSVRIRATDSAGAYTEKAFTITVNYVFDTSSIRAFYKLDDVNDASGQGRTLTNNGTATFVSGKVGNCANFASASSQYLSHADHNNFSFTGDWTIWGWVYLTTGGTNSGIISKASAFDAANYEWALIINTSNQIQSLISNGTTDSFMTGTTFGALSTGTWYFFAQRYDSVNDLHRLRINTTDQSVSWTGGSHNTSRAVTIGGRTPGGSLINGKIDDLGIAARHLTDTELLEIYNSGNGRVLFN